LQHEYGQPLARWTPFAASGLALRLGGLARWCLRREVLELAAADDAIPSAYRTAWLRIPPLPARHGSCWVVFAVERPAEWPWLRPAFALPLRWVERRAETGTGSDQDDRCLSPFPELHSPLLPAALARLATDAVKLLGDAPQPADVSWGLELSPELAAVDLRDMPLACGSGWAALAAGLLVAAEDGTPDPQVWATGSWNDGSGVQRVDHLKAKLDLAVEFGANAVFVPSAQVSEAQALAPNLEICSLRMGTREPRSTLADYVLRLEAPPPPPTDVHDEAGFQRCVTYYLKRPRGQARTTKFYWSHLLPTVTERCRVQVRRDWPGCQPTHLVTIVSGSPELVPLAVRAIGVKNCLLLYTPHQDSRLDQTSAMESVKAVLEGDQIECAPAPFEDNEALAEQIPDFVRQFGSGLSPDSLVLDITPGNKWMTWVTDRAMPNGSWRLYVRNDTLTPTDRRPRPGSEQLICWQV
jgi:hypothetical protein